MHPPERHIVFSETVGWKLEQALTAADRDFEILNPCDNFSFGPIATDDPDVRARWIGRELRYPDWYGCHAAVAFLERFRAERTPVTAWISRQDTYLYAGFLWWLSHVDDVQISVIDRPDMQIIAAHSADQPGKLIELIEQAVPLPVEQRRLYQARWEELKREDAPFRVVNGEELVSAPIDHFDAMLLGLASDEWQKMTKIMGDVWERVGVFTASDMVLFGRLNHLIDAGRLEWRGDRAVERHCYLRLPAA